MFFKLYNNDCLLHRNIFLTYIKLIQDLMKKGVNLLGVIGNVAEIVVAIALIYESRKNKKIEQLLLGIFILGVTFGEIVPILNEINIVSNIFTVVMLLVLFASILIFLKRKINTKSKLNK